MERPKDATAVGTADNGPYNPRRLRNLKDPAGSGFSRVYNDHVWRVYGFFTYRLLDRGIPEDLHERVARGD